MAQWALANVAQIGPVLVYFIYFHGWHAAFLWLACGPNLANRSRPPKWHHSTWYVGQKKVSGVGLIWASGILLSGTDAKTQKIEPDMIFFPVLYLGHLIAETYNTEHIWFTPWLAFVDCAKFLPKGGPHWLALFGPYSLFTTWATLGSHSDYTLLWTPHLCLQRPTFDLIHWAILLFYMWAASGLHPFCRAIRRPEGHVIALSGPHLLSGVVKHFDRKGWWMREKIKYKHSSHMPYKQSLFLQKINEWVSVFLY